MCCANVPDLAQLSIKAQSHFHYGSGFFNKKMSRYLQVYQVEVIITTKREVHPTDGYLFSFLNRGLGKKINFIGGINLHVNRIYSEDSIKDTSKPKLNEAFTIFDFATRTVIGTGKIVEILVQE